MSKARQLADLLDSNGDVTTGALDNVPPSNDASALTTGTLPIARIADGAVTAAKIGSLPAGSVLQVVYSKLGSKRSFNQASTSYSLVGLSATITPKNADSKILVTASMNVAGESGNYVVNMRLFRNGTYIEVGNDDGGPGGFITVGAQGWDNYFRYQASNTFLDEPNTTSAITYDIGVSDTRNGDTVHLNRSFYNDTSGAVPVPACTLTVIEIAG